MTATETKPRRSRRKADSTSDAPVEQAVEQAVEQVVEQVAAPDPVEVPPAEVQPELGLLPQQATMGVYSTVPLDDLPDNAALDHPRPSPGLIDLIRAAGVIEPIILADDGDGGYAVYGGTRRIAACRILRPQVTDEMTRLMLGIDPMRAIVFPAGYGREAALAIALHATRSDNTSRDVRKLKQLLYDGFGKQDICKKLHLAPQTYERLAKLARLPDVLLDAMHERKIAPGVAERAAALTTEQLGRIVSVFRETGKVTGHDVLQVKQVGSAAAVTSLPAELFGMGRVEDVPANGSSLTVHVRHDELWSEVESVAEKLAEVEHALEKGVERRELFLLVRSLRDVVREARGEGRNEDRSE